MFLAGTSIALAILVVVLSLQNRALERALAAERDAHAGTGAARLAPGESLRPLALLTRDGALERLAFDGAGGDALLLFYAETCNVCPQVFLQWQELAPQFASEGVRVAAVQLDRKGGSAPYGPAEIASFALADFAGVPLAKLATVPLTLLVDARGTVRWAHYGTLTPSDMGALVAFLPAGG